MRATFGGPWKMSCSCEKIAWVENRSGLFPAQTLFGFMPNKVLIVDDAPLMGVLYKNELERAGYELVTAEDGAEVVEVAIREKPQVIFMDIIMAQMDGLAALRELKKGEETKEIPVVITTASVSAHQATKKE